MNESPDKNVMISLAAGIVEKHVSNNTVPVDDLPGLIQQVYRTLSDISAKSSNFSEEREPAVPITASIHPDHIICLEDGRKLKMLKRYLQRAYNLTPEAYRQRWGLSADYPMVAPNYSKKRSTLAKGFGLGARYSKG